MMGQDLSANLPARRKAQKRIKEARLIFTTCTGSSLGLLRAILVGDHVQLRATVQQNAVLTGYDISLFERHYNMPKQSFVAKAMLNTQYRMHKTMCDLSSKEFYEGKLQTAVADDSRPLPQSQFP
jgi:hypothetical protein